MAFINKKFYKGEDEYSDGSVEDTILEIVKNKHELEPYYESDENWPIFYHLSHLRENILNWYPFKENCSILEIGAGCGALTGLLSKKSDYVKSVELTSKRAEIIHERHKHKDNLEILVGNLNNMEFEEKFDYVIINGVLEYAKQFTDSNDPFRDFLIKIRSFLKSDGVILLAIENRIGLKYLAGFREDHTGRFFSGINDYGDDESIRTFSKLELERLIENVGFSNYKFFYPFPDYKFPKVIFTDDSIEDNLFNCEIPNYDQERAKFFDESLLNSSLKKEGISKHFSNSFLVEMTNYGSDLSDNIKFVKLNSDRKEEFRIATSVEEYNGEKIAIKSPLSKKAENHLNLMKKSQKSNNIDFLHYLPCKMKENKLIFPFIKNETFEESLLNLINEHRIEDFKKNIKTFHGKLVDSSIIYDNYHSNKFSEVFGVEREDKNDNSFNKCLEYPNIDLIFGNIFPEKEEYIVIDYEWCFKFPIPVDFILWRSISNLYNLNAELENIIPINNVLTYLNLPNNNYPLFIAWEIHLQKFILGNNSYKIFIDPQIINKPVICLNSDNISRYPYDMISLGNKDIEINELKSLIEINKILLNDKDKLLKKKNKEIKNIKSKLKKSDKLLKQIQAENKKIINSIRYQVGTLMVKASNPSKTTISWPYHLIRLFLKSKQIKEKEDLNISKKSKEEKKSRNDVFKKFSSQEIDKIIKNMDNHFKTITNDFQKLKIYSKKDLNIDPNKKSILYAVHAWGGGAYYTAEDLMKGISKYENTFILIPKNKKMDLYYYDFEKGKIKIIHSFNLKNEWNNQKIHLKEYRNIYFNILVNLDIDLVHIHHLITQSFDLPEIAKKLNIPVVFSLHDYYFVCPSIHLLDDNLSCCNGLCDNSKSTCRKFSTITFGNNEDIRGHVNGWRKKCLKMFENVDKFVYTSEFLKKIYLSTYPDLNKDKFIFIEHGEDFSEENEKLFTLPSKDKPIKILFSNVHNEIKGLEVIKLIKNLDIDENLEFHFLGNFNHSLDGYGKFHGKFKRNKFHEKVKEISPSFIGVLSIWPETFSYVLSEAWACGIPVLGTNMGALGERISENGGGWFIDYKNPEKAYDSILKIAANLEDYKKIQKEVENINLRPIEDMGNDYLLLYRDLLEY